MSGSRRPSGSAMAANAQQHGDPLPAPRRLRCSAGAGLPSRRRAARRASAVGAAESHATSSSARRSPAPTMPHHIGRTMTLHAARAIAPPSVSLSSRRTTNPTDEHQRRRGCRPPTAPNVQPRGGSPTPGDSAMPAAKQTSASTGSSHARTPRAWAMAIVVSANAWSPIDANVIDTSDREGSPLRRHRGQHGADHCRGIREPQRNRVGVPPR